MSLLGEGWFNIMHRDDSMEAGKSSWPFLPFGDNVLTGISSVPWETVLSHCC